MSDKHNFKAGDKVHYGIGSDTYPATVVETTAQTVTVRRDKFHLDPEWEMDFIPGGFVGHVVNNHAQKNVIEDDPKGETAKFSVKRMPKKYRDYHSTDGYRVLLSGTSWESGIALNHGWQAFRDFNF